MGSTITQINECGCTARLPGRGTGELRAIYITYCPTHAAAPDMLDALEGVEEFAQECFTNFVGDTCNGNSAEYPVQWVRVLEVLNKIRCEEEDAD